MVNMQLPPPCVTGIAIPANLEVKNDLAMYNELKDLRQQARNGLHTDYNNSLNLNTKKNKSKLKTALKITTGALLSVAAFLGIKKLIKK